MTAALSPPSWLEAIAAGWIDDPGERVAVGLQDGFPFVVLVTAMASSRPARRVTSRPGRPRAMGFSLMARGGAAGGLSAPAPVTFLGGSGVPAPAPPSGCACGLRREPGPEPNLIGDLV